MFSLLLLFPTQTEATSYRDISNVQHDWYFKKSINHQPAETEPEFKELLQKYDGIYIGNTEKKVLYLTFDNGYENGYTHEVLDTLQDKHVPAAFFVTGHYLQDQPELVKRMVSDGHIVGNHSWSHPDFTDVSNKQITEELKRVKDKFTAITGIKEMKYLRPPRGVFSERTLAHSNELGYTNVFWSLAYRDWETDKQKGSSYAYDKIMNQVHPGAILLLHSVSRDNAKALPRIIDELKKEGYEFHSLDQFELEKRLDPLFMSPNT
nr:delta-lactam-biosynthetic de-N-acetylase [Mechercharimyces sp. CAU 1602]